MAREKINPAADARCSNAAAHPSKRARSSDAPQSELAVVHHPVTLFLASLQLQGYSANFIADHGFTTLESLALHIHSENDLVEMGVRPLAHRRAIMAAINKNRKIWLRPGPPTGTSSIRSDPVMATGTLSGLGRRPTFSQACRGLQRSRPADGEAGRPTERLSSGNPFTALPQPPTPAEPLPQRHSQLVLLTANTESLSNPSPGIDVPGADTTGRASLHHIISAAIRLTEAEHRASLEQLRQNAEHIASTLTLQLCGVVDELDARRRAALDDIRAELRMRLLRMRGASPSDEDVQREMCAAMADASTFYSDPLRAPVACSGRLRVVSTFEWEIPETANHQQHPHADDAHPPQPPPCPQLSSSPTAAVQGLAVTQLSSMSKATQATPSLLAGVPVEAAQAPGEAPRSSVLLTSETLVASARRTTTTTRSASVRRVEEWFDQNPSFQNTREVIEILSSESSGDNGSRAAMDESLNPLLSLPNAADGEDDKDHLLVSCTQVPLRSQLPQDSQACVIDVDETIGTSISSSSSADSPSNGSGLFLDNYEIDMSDSAFFSDGGDEPLELLMADDGGEAKRTTAATPCTPWNTGVEAGNSGASKPPRCPPLSRLAHSSGNNSMEVAMNASGNLDGGDDAVLGCLSLAGVAWGAEPALEEAAPARAMLDQMLREGVVEVTHRMPDRALRKACVDLGLVVNSNIAVTRGECEQALRKLCARAAFRRDVASVLQDVPSFRGGPPVDSSSCALHSRSALDRTVLTQAEMNEHREAVRRAEDATVAGSVLGSLAHDTMNHYLLLSASACSGDEGASVKEPASLTAYEAILLREGVALERAVAIVHKEFPKIAKYRVEALLKSCGVPLDVAKNSPAAQKRFRYFSQKRK